MKQQDCQHCGNKIGPFDKRCPVCHEATAGADLNDVERGEATGYEWRSELEFLGIPFVHIAWGKDEAGKIRIAKGIIAIGQIGIGLITFAQIGIGFLFGFGQLMFGLTAIGQVAITLFFGIGQIATGYVAIGQLAAGYYTLAMLGVGVHLWSSEHVDEQAVTFFRQLADFFQFWKG